MSFHYLLHKDGEELSYVLDGLCRLEGGEGRVEAVCVIASYLFLGKIFYIFFSLSHSPPPSCLLLVYIPSLAL